MDFLGTHVRHHSKVDLHRSLSAGCWLQEHPLLVRGQVSQKFLGKSANEVRKLLQLAFSHSNSQDFSFVLRVFLLVHR